MGLSSLFCKLRVLFIFGLIFEANSLELCTYSLKNLFLDVEVSGAFEFASSQLNDQIGEFGVLYNLGEDKRLDGLHGDGRIFLAPHLADGPQALANCRIKVILDGVVGPE